MNIEQLHSKFDDANMRNYLSKTFTKSAKISLFVSIKELENQISVLQEKLEHAKIVESIDCIIKDKNWRQFDISDITYYNEDTYIHFVGTEEEYKKVLDICKGE